MEDQHTVVTVSMEILMTRSLCTENISIAKNHFHSTAPDYVYIFDSFHILRRKLERLRSLGTFNLEKTLGVLMAALLYPQSVEKIEPSFSQQYITEGQESVRNSKQEKSELIKVNFF